jgi:hypothetical protein
MTDEPDQQPEPTEKLPKTGLRVPVPTRKDVMDAIRKAAKPDEPDRDEDLGSRVRPKEKGRK